MKKANSILAAVAMFCGAQWAGAHLVAGSLSIKASDKFKTGEVVAVKWRQNEGHAGKYDFKYSKDGGTTFVDVEKGKQMPTAAGELTYSWTVPNEAAAHAVFKVCQQAGSNPAACSDATYMLQSPHFTIESGSAVRPFAGSEGAGLRFDAGSRNLEVSFSLARGERVTLLAYDAGGRLLATLVDKDYAAGDHRFSAFSNALDVSGAKLFQLRLGDQVHSLRH